MLMSGNYDGALRDFNNAIELNSTYAEAWANKANAKIHLNQYFEAIPDCNKSIQLKADLSQGYYFRGMCKVNLGDKMGGCMDLSKAGDASDIKMPIQQLRNTVSNLNRAS